MSDFVLGMAVGIAIGVAMAYGRGRKLTPEEKKRRKWAVIIGLVVAAIVAIVFLGLV